MLPKKFKLLLFLQQEKAKFFLYIFDFYWLHLVIKESLVLPKLTQKYQV